MWTRRRCAAIAAALQLPSPGPSSPVNIYTYTTLRPYPQGYIDLSKRRVSPEEIRKCEEKYNKAKIVNTILRTVADATDFVRRAGGNTSLDAGFNAGCPLGLYSPTFGVFKCSSPLERLILPPLLLLARQNLEELYERTAWKLEMESGPGSSYERFKLAVTYVRP